MAAKQEAAASNTKLVSLIRYDQALRSQDFFRPFFGSRQLRASQHRGSADPSSSRDGAAKYKDLQHFNFKGSMSSVANF